jgi:GH15 family glucan-1,4-alpha-glucosidase
MYRFDGTKDLDESTLTNLRGYRGSRPVRIGNGAHHQLQLDIYGELMDAIYLSAKYDDITDAAWRDARRLVTWVSEHWQDPDEGIWEVRSGRKCFLHSRVMCWVTIDRAIRLARQRSLPGPLGEWGATRDRIYEDIFTNFWDAERGTFVREKGSRSVDASALLMPLMRFVSPTDPRWIGTLRAIEQDLVEGPLVYRYDTERDADGLRGDEGSFTACSFWYIECLTRAHEIDKARFLFEKMLGYANHVGLFSEEIGMSGGHLGNYPQAFTHLALISAAYALDAALDGKDTKKPWR